MSITFFNFKGGVGKSSLAIAYALSRELPLVTNDLTRLDHMGLVGYVHLPENKKRIHPSLLTDTCVYDLGAMNGRIDPKVIDALEHSHAVVIPTLSDAHSIHATVEAIGEAKELCESIFVVINKVRTPDRQYDAAHSHLLAHLPESRILTLKESTLYPRLANDGRALFERIYHAKGYARLRNALAVQHALFDTIDAGMIHDAGLLA